MLFSIIRSLIGMVPAALLAIPFYGFSVFDLGLPVLFLFFNLMFMGWWLGLLINAMLIKAGPGGESLAWAITFLLGPLCAVYYPMSILPEWLQHVSNAIPATHVFEALRALVREGRADAFHIWTSFLLNCGYMTFSIAILQLSFNNARKAGTLLQSGE
jgi:ABC-2 type transport system permease protein